MSITYQTICDNPSCKLIVSGWPQSHDDSTPYGWVSANLDPLVNWNFCPDCWTKMLAAIGLSIPMAKA